MSCRQEASCTAFSTALAASTSCGPTLPNLGELYTRALCELKLCTACGPTHPSLGELKAHALWEHKFKEAW